MKIVDSKHQKYVNKNPTRCNSMQIFIYCKVTLYVLKTVTTASGIPEAVVIVFSTPDDGCCDTRNM